MNEPENLNLEGKEYVSSTRAAKLTGYSKDYIGQLAREDKIDAKMIGRKWFVCEESILSHKDLGYPTPLHFKYGPEEGEEMPQTGHSLNAADEEMFSDDGDGSVEEGTPLEEDAPDEVRAPSLIKTSVLALAILAVLSGLGTSVQAGWFPDKLFDARDSVSNTFTKTGEFVSNSLTGSFAFSNGRLNSDDEVFENKKVKVESSDDSTGFVASLWTSLSKNTVSIFSTAGDFIDFLARGTRSFITGLFGNDDEDTLAVEDEVAPAENLNGEPAGQFPIASNGDPRETAPQPTPQPITTYRTAPSNPPTNTTALETRLRNLELAFASNLALGNTGVDLSSYVTNEELRERLRRQLDVSSGGGNDSGGGGSKDAFNTITIRGGTVDGVTLTATTGTFSGLLTANDGLTVGSGGASIEGDLTVNGDTIVSNGSINVGDKIIAPGEVGIGTSTTYAKLSVLSTDATQRAFTIWGHQSQSVPLVEIYDNATTSNPLFFVTEDGKVGIGTSTPAETFTLNGAAYLSQISAPATTADRLYNTGGDLYWAGSIVGGSTVGHWTTDGTNVWRAGGKVGIGTTTPGYTLDIYATDAIRIPVGTTAQRPGTLNTGLLRYNSTNSSFEGYNGTGWTGLGGVIDVDQDTKILAELSSGSDDDALFFYTGGTEWMRLDSSGRLGVGTTSPASKLDVWGDLRVGTSSTPTLFTQSSTGRVGVGTASPLRALDIYGTSGAPSPTGSTGVLRLQSSTNSVIDFGNYDVSPWGNWIQSHDKGTGANYSLLLNPNGGNVGVGVDTASAKLHVSGSAIFQGVGSNGFRITPSSDSNSPVLNVTNAANTVGWLQVNANGQIIMNGSGNVGIGTTSPSAKLQVTNTGNGASFLVEDSASPDTTPFIIDPSGVVGIGTLSPKTTESNLLDVHGAARIKNELTLGVSGVTSGSLKLMRGFETGGFFQVSGTGVGVSANWSGSRLHLSSATGFTGIEDTHPDAHLEVSANGTTGGNIFLLSSDDNNDGDLLTVTEAGSVGIGTTTPTKTLDIVGSGINLENTTSDSTGVIFKNGTRFIHNFQHPTGNTAVPDGFNTFVGLNSGNFTMGSTATQSWNGSLNTAVGYSTLSSNTTGHGHTAVGYQALKSNTTGTLNSAFGRDALSANTSGASNVAVGYAALQSNTTGNSNNAVGYEALVNNIGGRENQAFGEQALMSNTSGIQNVAIGWRSAQGNTTGGANTALGHQALYYNAGGSSNVAIGQNTGAGVSGSSITGNTLLGSFSGSGLTTSGNYNTLIGYQAGDNLTTGARNIIIGYSTDAPSATGSDQLNIGDTIYGSLSTGNVGIGTTSPASKLDVWGDLRVGTSSTPTLFAQSSTGRVGIGTVNPLTKLHINGGVGSLSTGLSFGDGDTGFYETADDSIGVAFSDSLKYTMNQFGIFASGGPFINFSLTAGATTPNIMPRASDPDTGLGSISNDLRLIAAGKYVISARGTGTSNTASVFGVSGQTANLFEIWSGQGSTAGDILTVDSAGNVGIGTTSPASKLDVWGDLRVGTSSTPTLFAQTSTGRVGIGTASPSTLLHLGSGNGSNTLSIQKSNAGEARIDFQVADGTVYKRLGMDGNQNFYVSNEQSGTKFTLDRFKDFVIGGNNGSIITMYYNSGSNPTNYLSTITQTGNAEVDGVRGLVVNVEPGANASNYGFAVNFDNDNKFLINKDGNVGIGTTSPAFKLNVWGTVGFLGLSTNTASANRVVCQISTTGELVTAPSGSDCSVSSQRFKDDIQDLGVGLEALRSLRPVSFKYKHNNVEHIGFIAEEVLGVDPRLVIFEEDGRTPYSVYYSETVALAVKAIQELDLKLSDIEKFAGFSDETKDKSLFDVIMEKIAGLGVKIFGGKIVVDNELCIEEVCVNKTQLKQLLENSTAGLPAQTGGASGASTGPNVYYGTTTDNAWDDVTTLEEQQAEENDEVGEEEEVAPPADEEVVTEDEEVIEDSVSGTEQGTEEVTVSEPAQEGGDVEEVAASTEESSTDNSEAADTATTTTQ